MQKSNSESYKDSLMKNKYANSTQFIHNKHKKSSISNKQVLTAKTKSSKSLLVIKKSSGRKSLK